jgi:hypothetical protein
MTRISGFRSGLMPVMSASDMTIALAGAYGCGGDEVQEPDANPGPHEARVRDLIADSYRVLLIGRDLYMLMEKLANPVRFWNTHRGRKTLSIWVAIVTPTRTKHIYDIDEVSYLFKTMFVLLCGFPTLSSLFNVPILLCRP